MDKLIYAIDEKDFFYAWIEYHRFIGGPIKAIMILSCAKGKSETNVFFDFEGDSMLKALVYLDCFAVANNSKIEKFGSVNDIEKYLNSKKCISENLIEFFIYANNFIEGDI